VQYSYTIPREAVVGQPIRDTIAVTGTDQIEGCSGGSATIGVVIDVLADPLAVAPTSLELRGAPGATVSDSLNVTGGVAPYGADSASNNGTASVSGSTVNYSFTIPDGARDRFTDTITVTDEAEGRVSVPVTIIVERAPADPLVVNPNSLKLIGIPGESLSAQLSISGGTPEYSAETTLGTVSVSGGTISYRYTIPAGASGELRGTIRVSDSGTPQKTSNVQVVITVQSPVEISPSPLELKGISLVGATLPATADFQVSGGTPPYRLAVTSGEGAVEPAQLSTQGTATYSVTIPENMNAEVLTAEITVTDAAGRSSTSPVSVAVQAADALSSNPDLTPNQRSVAQAIETLCPQLMQMQERNAAQQDLFEQCSAMISNPTLGGTETSLSQVTTEKAEAAASSGIANGQQQFANVGSRLAALRRGATGVSVQGLAFNLDGQSVPTAQIADALTTQLTGGAASGDSPFGRWGFFVNGSFNFGDKDPTDNESGFDFSTTGLTMGADYRFTDDLIAGAAVGYGRSDVSFDSSGGSLDTTTWHIAAYGTYSWAENGYVDGIIEYGWQDYQSGRNIRYQIGNNDKVLRQADADYGGNQLGVSIGAGYDFDKGPLTYGVYGRAGYLEIDVDGYTESGASGLNLSVDGFSSTSVTSTLGARISRVFNTGRAVLVPQARFEWEHEFDQDADSLVARFTADPTATAFGIETDSPDRDYFRVGLGLSAVMPHGLSAFVNYDAVIDRRDWTENLIDVGLRWEFY